MGDNIADPELRQAQVQTPCEVIDALTELAWSLRQTQPERAASLCHKACSLSVSGEFCVSPYRQGQAASLATLGYLDHQAGRLDAALSRCLEAAVLLDSLPPSRVSVDCRRTLSWIFYFLGDQSGALSHALQALRLAQQLNLPIQEATVLDGLAMIYSASGDSPQALQSNEAALRIARFAGDGLLETTTLNNRANILLESGNCAAALESAKQSLQLARRLALTAQEVSILDTLGGIHIARGDYAPAEQRLSEGLALATRIGLGLAQTYYCMNLGDLYLKQSDIEQAAANYHQALAHADSDGTLALQAQCHLRLSGVYERMDNMKQALVHHKSFYALQEQVAGETSQKRLAILKVAHQVETAQRDAEIYRLRNVEMQHEIDERKRVEQELEHLATIDQLTGVYNRRYFFELAQRDYMRANRYGRSLTVLMLDVDHFKVVNDTHGHAVGDQVLAQAGAFIRKIFHGVDAVGRYGGDEFCIAMPETNTEQGHMAATGLQKGLATQTFATSAGSLSVTVSIGLSSLRSGDAAAHDSLEKLLDRADRALYRAKDAGRNCVRCD